MLKNYKRSYFTNIFVAFTVILVILSVVISVTFYYTDQKSRISESMQNSKAFLSNFATWNGMRIKTAESILNSIMSDNNVIKYAVSGDIELLKSINNKLFDYSKVCSELSIKLGVLDLARNSSVTTSYINHIDLNSVLMPSKLNSSHFVLYDKDCFYYRSTPVIIGSTFVRERVYANDNTLIFFYTLSSPPSGKFSTAGGNTYKMFFNDSSILTLGDYKDNFEFNKISENSPVFSKKHAVYKQISSSNICFSYYYIDPIPSDKKSLIIALTLLVLMLPTSVLLSYIISNSLYKPIILILRKISVLENESAESDTNIYSAISKLDKYSIKMKDLNSRMLSAENLLSQMFINDMCLANLTQNEIELNIQKYGFAFLKEKHFQICFTITNPDELTDIYGSDGLLYLKKDIVDIFSDKLKKSAYFYSNYYSITFLVAGEYDLSIADSIRERINWFANTFDILIAAFVSNEIDNYTQESSAYTSIMMLCGNDDVFSMKPDVYLVDELSSNASKLNNKICYTMNYEQQLTDFIISGQENNVRRMIDTIVSLNFSANSPREKITMMQDYIRLTINRILEDTNQTIESVYPDPNVLKPCDNSKLSINEILFNMVSPLLKHNVSFDEDEYKKKIDNYINTHIKDNISLDDLAGYLNYSTSYTSKMFKKIFNQTFKSYTTYRRVEIAKDLLNKGYTVTEVTHAVGCGNAGSFIRIFKKATGISPGEYKKISIN